MSAFVTFQFPQGYLAVVNWEKILVNSGHDLVAIVVFVHIFIPDKK